MNKSFILLTASSLLAISASAQDIYKMEQFSSSDLNGTARFVGMGGAMNALGADISTMSTNPAGIGVYRRSDVSASASLNIQTDAESFADRGKNRVSFDQIGFVYSTNLGNTGLKFINFGFNYHKSKNFKNFLGAKNIATNGLSQTWQMMDMTYGSNGYFDLTSDNDRELIPPVALKGYDVSLLEQNVDQNGNITGYSPVNANSYTYKKASWGGIQEYDFNIAFNWNDQIYAGFTFGAYNVDMHSYLDYSEQIYLDSPTDAHEYYMTNSEEISGSGYDFKAGVIIRPIEESPFRFGVAIHSPIFFDLEQNQRLYMNSPFNKTDANGNVVANYQDASFDPGENTFDIRTPWKFLVSAATTVGNVFAIDAEYEYADYSSAQVRYETDHHYWDDWSHTTKDRALAREADKYLRDVHTFRIGAEARVAPNLFLRAGYNYISSPFKESAFLNQFTESSSYYYSCNTDYVNLGATNRATFGIGYRGKNFYVDAAYQYQHQDADLYAFHLPNGNSDTNRLEAHKLNLEKQQILFTVGYKF